MGQSVLANHFVSGLRPELKSKVVGFEGSFEQLPVLRKQSYKILLNPGMDNEEDISHNNKLTPNNSRMNATGNRPTRQQDQMQRCYTCNKLCRPFCKELYTHSKASTRGLASPLLGVIIANLSGVHVP